MAGKMMLVNPKRRTRRKTTAKRRTPARRKTSAAARRRTPARKTNASVRRRTRSAAPARRRRRNPRPRGAMRYIRPALVGGGSAVGIDIAMGYAPLPDVLSTGYGRHATKAAAAIALGLFLPKMGVVKRATAENAAQGALTVFAADALREGVAQFLPDVPLGYYSPAYVPPGQGSGMSEYLTGTGEYLSGGTPSDPFGYSQSPQYGPLGEYVEPNDTASMGY